MSKRARLFANIILMTMLFMLSVISLLLYINYYPRVAVHLISEDELYESLDVKKGGILPVLPTPNKTGANFSGWYLDKDYTSPYDFDSQLDEDVELYAKFDLIDYTLTFYVENDRFVYSPKTLNYSVLIILPSGTEEVIINNQSTTLNTYKEGYVFDGWSTSPSSQKAEYPAGYLFEMQPNNVDLYAIWVPKNYTVVYRSQSLSSDDYALSDIRPDDDNNWVLTYNDYNDSNIKYVDYPYSYKISAPETPVDPYGNFVFGGWYLDEGFTKGINYNQTYMGLNTFTHSTLDEMYNEEEYTREDEYIVLFAKWYAVTYEVEFDLNTPVGSYISGLDSSIITTVNGIQKLKPIKNVFNGMTLNSIYTADVFKGKVINNIDGKPSHAFGSWNTKADGSGNTYSNGRALNKYDAENGVVTLYANWNEYYYINYVTNSGRDLYTQEVVLGQTIKLQHINEFTTYSPVTGYTFSNWMNTQIYDASRTRSYFTDREYTTTINTNDENYLLFNANTKQVNLFPYNLPNVYNINYDLSLYVSTEDGYNKLNNNPNGTNVSFINQEDVDTENTLLSQLQREYTYTYGNTAISNQHTVLHGSNGSTSYASYVYEGTTYLLDKWLIVNKDGNIMGEVNGGEKINFTSNNKFIENAINIKDTLGKETRNNTIQLVALWAKEVTVTFAAPSGDEFNGTVPAPLKTMTGKYTVFHKLSDVQLTRNHYQFMGWGYDGQKYDKNNPDKRFYLKDGILYIDEECTIETTFAPFGGTGDIGGEITDNVTVYPIWKPYTYTINVYNSNENGASPVATIHITTSEGSNQNYTYYKIVELGYPILVGEERREIYFTRLQTEGYDLINWKLADGTLIGVNEELTLRTLAGENYIFNPTPTSESDKIISITAVYGLKTFGVEITTEVDGVNDGCTYTLEDVQYGTSLKQILEGIQYTLDNQNGYIFSSWNVEVNGETQVVTSLNSLTTNDIIKGETKITLVTDIQSYRITVIYVDPTTNSTLTTNVYNVKHGVPLSEHFENLNAGETEYKDPEDCYGYTLKGFKDSGENELYTLAEFKSFAPTIVTGNKSFKAEYTPKNVVVVYKSNVEGEIIETSFEDTSKKYNENITLSSAEGQNGFINNGYKLTGWAVNADGSNYVGEVGSDYKLTNSTDNYLQYDEDSDKFILNLYAVWTKLVTLTFDVPSGVTASGLPETTQYIIGTQVKLNSVITQSSYEVTKVGYVHNYKWIVNNDEDSVVGLTDTLTLSENITLTPVFEPDTVTINYYYVYAPESTKYTLTSDSFDFGDEESITLPTINSDKLSYGGKTYIPVYWTLNGTKCDLGATFDVTQAAISTNGSMVFEFVLALEPQLKIVYHNNYDGASDGKELMVIYNNEYTIGDFDSRGNADLYVPTRFGYNFIGWNTQMNGQGTNYENGDTYKVTDRKGVTLFAIWDAKDVNVILHSNYPTGENETSTLSGEFDGIVWLEGEGFDFEGYSFLGWATEANSTTLEYGKKDSVSIDFEQDLNLYAVWAKLYSITYKSVYNANGDFDTYTEPKECLAGKHQLSDKPYNFHNKIGYTFAGWNFNGITYNANEPFTITEEHPAEIVFEANWVIMNLTVTINTLQTDGTYDANEYDVDYGDTFTLETNVEPNLTINGDSFKLAGFSSDENGEVEFESTDGSLKIENVTDNITLYTIYNKYYTLTYLDENGDTISSEYYQAGTQFGYEFDNPFEVTSKTDHVFIGWKDEEVNILYYRLIEGDSGYNYATDENNGFADRCDILVLNKNTRLSPVFAEIHTLNIYTTISTEQTNQNVELGFDYDGTIIYFNNPVTKTGVMGDKISVSDEANDTNILGWVKQEEGYKYNPNQEIEYKGIDSSVTNEIFEFTNADVNLIPLILVNISFEGDNIEVDDKIIIAGQTVEEPVIDENNITYIDAWVDEKGSEVIFGSSRFFKNTTLTANMLNYYSVEYLDDDIANKDKLKQIKLKPNDHITLAGEYNTVDGVEVKYVKNGFELKGWKLKISENEIYEENGEQKIFVLGSTFTIPANENENYEGYLPNGVYLYQFVPVWEGNIVEISFENPDDSIFKLTQTVFKEDEKLAEADDLDEKYNIVFGSQYTITNNGTSLTFGFEAVVDESTREKHTVIITATVKSGSYTLLNWKTGDTILTTNSKFENESLMNITFEYTADAISVSLAVKVEDIVQTNTNTAGFKIYDSASGEYGNLTYAETITGNGSVSFKVSAQAVDDKYVFDGWYDTNGKLSDSTEFSGEFESASTIYAKFILGTMNIKFDGAQYANGTAIDVNNTNFTSLNISDGTNNINVLDNTTLNIKNGETVTVDYTSTKYILHSAIISYDGGTTSQTINAENNKITFTPTNYNKEHTITLVFVDASLTVNFYGFGVNEDNVASATPITTMTVPYGDKLTTLPSVLDDVDNYSVDKYAYRCTGWNYDNSDITENTNIYSKWDKYKIYEVIFKYGLSSEASSESQYVTWGDESKEFNYPLAGYYNTFDYPADVDRDNHEFVWKIEEPYNLEFTNNGESYYYNIYDLLGRFDDKNSQTFYSGENENLDTITITAVYTPVYTVKFVSEDGETTYTNIKIGDEFKIPNKPTKIGYNFEGWISSDGSNEYNISNTYTEGATAQLVDGQVYNITDYVITYTASFTKKLYKIQFVSEDLTLGGFWNATEQKYEDSAVYYVQIDNSLKFMNGEIIFQGSTEMNGSVQTITLTPTSDIRSIKGVYDDQYKDINELTGTIITGFHAERIKNYSETEVNIFTIKFEDPEALGVKSESYAQKVENGALVNNGNDYGLNSSCATAVNIKNQNNSTDIKAGDDVTITVTENDYFTLTKLTYVDANGDEQTVNFEANAEKTFTLERISKNITFNLYFNRKNVNVNFAMKHDSGVTVQSGDVTVKYNDSETFNLSTTQTPKTGVYGTKSCFTLTCAEQFDFKVEYREDGGAWTEFKGTSSDYFYTQDNKYYITHTGNIEITVTVEYKPVKISFEDYGGNVVTNLTLTSLKYNDALTTEHLADLLDNHNLGGTNSARIMKQTGWSYNGTVYNKTTSDHTTIIGSLTTDVTFTSSWTKLYTIQFVDENGYLLSSQQVTDSEDINFDAAKTQINSQKPENTTLWGWVYGEATTDENIAVYVTAGGKYDVAVNNEYVVSGTNGFKNTAPTNLKGLLNGNVVRSLSMKNYEGDFVKKFECIYTVDIEFKLEDGYSLSVSPSDLTSYGVYPFNTLNKNVLTVLYNSSFYYNVDTYVGALFGYSFKYFWNCAASGNGCLRDNFADAGFSINISNTNSTKRVSALYYYDANKTENSKKEIGDNNENATLLIYNGVIDVVTSEIPHKIINVSNSLKQPGNLNDAIYDITLNVAGSGNAAVKIITTDDTFTGSIACGSDVSIKSIINSGALLTYNQISGMTIKVYVTSDVEVSAKITADETKMVLEADSNTCTLYNGDSLGQLSYEVETWTLNIQALKKDPTDTEAVAGDNDIIKVVYYTYDESSNVLSEKTINFEEFDGEDITLYKTAYTYVTIESKGATSYYYENYFVTATATNGSVNSNKDKVEINGYVENTAKVVVTFKYEAYLYTFVATVGENGDETKVELGSMKVYASTEFSDVEEFIENIEDENNNLTTEQTINIYLATKSEFNHKIFTGFDLGIFGGSIAKEDQTIQATLTDAYVHTYSTNVGSFNNYNENLGFTLLNSGERYIISSTPNGSTDGGIAVYSAVTLKSISSDKLSLVAPNAYYNASEPAANVNGSDVTLNYDFAVKTANLVIEYGYYNNGTWTKLNALANDSSTETFTVKATTGTLASTTINGQDDIDKDDITKPCYYTKSHWADATSGNEITDLSQLFADAFASEFESGTINIRYVYNRVEKSKLTIKDINGSEIASGYYYNGQTADLEALIAKNETQIYNINNTSKFTNIVINPTTATIGSEFACFTDGTNTYYVRIDENGDLKNYTDTTINFTDHDITLTEVRVNKYLVEFKIAGSQYENSAGKTVYTSLTLNDLSSAGFNISSTTLYNYETTSYVQGTELDLLTIEEVVDNLIGTYPEGWSFGSVNMAGNEGNNSFTINQPRTIEIYLQQPVLELTYVNQYNNSSKTVLVPAYQNYTVGNNDDLAGLTEDREDYFIGIWSTVNPEERDWFAYYSYSDTLNQAYASGINYKFKRTSSLTLYAIWLPESIKSVSGSNNLEKLVNYSLSFSDYDTNANKGIINSIKSSTSSKISSTTESIILPEWVLYVSYTQPFALSGEYQFRKVETIGDGQISVVSSDLTSLKEITIGQYTTKIGGYAFKDCTSLTTVKDGENVTTIGASAFYGCTNLQSLPNMESIETINNYAFQYCRNLNQIGSENECITLNNITSLGIEAFEGCATTYTGINKVVIGDELKSISNNAFYSCLGLKEVQLGSGLTDIGKYAFYSCTSLTTVKGGSNVKTIGDSAFGSCVNLKSVEFGENITTIDDHSFANCSELVGNTNSILNLPELTKVGSYAFKGCSSISNICNGSSGSVTKLTTIGSYAFKDCSNLKTLKAPESNYDIYLISVTSLGEGAFSGCTSIEKVYLKSNLNPTKASFNGCTSLSTVYGCGSINSIDESAFEGCTNLKGFGHNMSSITTIGKKAFYNCSALTSLSWSTLTTIGESAFESCEQLTRIGGTANVIDLSNVTTIDGEAFKGCTALTSIYINPNLDAIGDSAFSGCSKLTTVNGGENVTTIGASAFYGCTSLNSFQYMSSVTKIGSHAFYGCTSLTTVVLNNITSLSTIAFYGCTSLTEVTLNGIDTINVASYFTSSLTKITHVTLGTDDLTATNKTTTLAENCFKGMTNLQEVNLKASITDIGDYAFDRLANLTKVTGASGVTTIGVGAFMSCSQLTQFGNTENTVDLTNVCTLKTVEQTGTGSVGYQFSGCKSITTLQLDNTSYNDFVAGKITTKDFLYAIPTYAFQNCTLLSSIKGGDQSRQIAAKAFENCTSLTTKETNGEDSFTWVITTYWNIDDNAFYNCTNVSISEL